MNALQLAGVLALASTLDGRVGNTQMALEAWSAVLVPDIDGDWAMEFVRRWYGRNDDMLTPAVLNKGWADAKRNRHDAALVSSGMKCPYPDCRCSHTEPCVAGWLDNDAGTAVPCPQCRPGLSDLLTNMPEPAFRSITDMAVLRSSERDSREWNGVDRS